MKLACVMRPAPLGIALTPVAALMAAAPVQAACFQTILAFSDRADDGPWGGLTVGANGTLHATNSSNGPPWTQPETSTALP